MCQNSNYMGNGGVFKFDSLPIIWGKERLSSVQQYIFHGKRRLTTMLIRWGQDSLSSYMRI